MTITLSQFCQEQGALKEFVVWKLGLIENLKCLKWNLKCQLYFEFDILWLIRKKFINSCKGVLVQSNLGIGIPWEFLMFEVRFEMSNLFWIQYTLVHWKEFINPKNSLFNWKWNWILTIQGRSPIDEGDLGHPWTIRMIWGI
jgi:hypothetical protein